MVYVALAAFVLLVDRLAALLRGRRTGGRFERQRRNATFPLVNDTNWRQPSG